MQQHRSVPVSLVALSLALAACGSESSRQSTLPVSSSSEPTEPADVDQTAQSDAGAQAGAATEQPADHPAPPPAPTYVPGKWVWFELESTDPDRSAAFFSALLGWKMEPAEMAGMKFQLAKADGKQVADFARLAGARARSHWIPFVSVGDVDAAVKSVQDHKGTLVKPAMDMPGVGRMAKVADPTGAEFALFKSAKGDEPDSDGPAPSGQFAWAENQARNKKAASAILAFYSGALSYASVPMKREDKKAGSYDTLEWSDVPRAGVALAHPARLAGQWLPWVAVEDVDALVPAVKKLKGRVLVRPNDRSPIGRVMVVADPTGAALGLVHVSFAVMHQAP